MSTELIEQQLPSSTPTGTAIATTRQAQEVQAAMIVAKRFPRDEDAAVSRIIKSCCRSSLAEVACYEYTRGGQKITGPSIRLAEVLAQNWGNIDFGFVELERRKDDRGVGESVVQAHAWDLETNTRRTMTFNVKHWRDTKQGGYELKDERDIYEAMANQASRRVRACILSVVPGDVQDVAIEQCEKTLAGKSTEPIGDRVRKMLAAFQEIGVSKDMIEAKLNHATSACSNAELARLQKIYVAIRDGFGTREEHFQVTAPSDKPKTLGELAKAKASKAKTAAESKGLSFYEDEMRDAVSESEARDLYEAACNPDNGYLTTEDDVRQAGQLLDKRLAELKGQA